MLNTYQRNRLLLSLAAAAACTLFWLAGKWFGIPEHQGYEISLALQRSPAVDFLVVGVVLCAAVFRLELLQREDQRLRDEHAAVRAEVAGGVGDGGRSGLRHR